MARRFQKIPKTACSTRANRTRPRTQPHAKQQPTNAPPQTNLTITHTHLPTKCVMPPEVPISEKYEANQQTTPPRIAATLPQPPPRASALARGTIACASSTDLSASASARCLPCCCTCRSRCYDSALFPYARYSTVARLKLACSERLASHYNSDMTGLIEPGYSCVRLLTRPNPDYRKSSFPTEETILRVPLL